MNDIQKRFLAFLLGCILTRLLLVIVAKIIKPEYLPYMGYILLLPAIGFLIIYIGGYRKTGRETIGKKIWWNNLRPIHSLLYFSFVYLALQKSKYSYIPLLIDVVFGLISFLIYHYSVNSFASLL